MSEIEKCKECGNKEIYQDNLCFKCFGKRLFSGLGEKSKEQQLQEKIERLEEDNKKLKECLGIVSPSREFQEGKYWEKEDNEEIERLHFIINEVREKIENTTINCDGVAEDLIDDILEILDKENK